MTSGADALPSTTDVKSFVARLHLYVWTNSDGVLVCPWMDPAAGIDSSKRIFVGGGPIHELNDLQLRSLIEIAFRDPNILKGKSCAIFYDGNDWKKKHCPDGKRGKKLLVLQLSDPGN
jgi:hypothetical protein